MRPLVKYLSVLGVIVVLGGGIIIYNVLHNTDKESADDNASSENTSEENSNDVQSVSSSESETIGQDEIGMTPDEFEQRFNKEAKKLLGENGKSISLEYSDGDKLNNFSYEFNNNLILVGGFEKDTNKIAELILVTKDELEGDNLKSYLQVVGVIVKVFNPYMTTNEITSMIYNKLDVNNVINEHEVKSSKVESETYGKLRYSFNYSSEKLGLLFTISISNK
ncbi:MULTISPECIES: hypothetical protein [Bacillus]|uniref:Uncharacterized protein n=1 Tax=Bacillus glycinifermentans TaxID=1664069 RepID=A0AAJ4D2B9_9BACI|nr:MULTISPECIES: hypothetical protein [Bacillus]HWO77780.1 hypothetical protein [Bacillus sp. (in: firmicutes)]KKB71942.1 hypothetical protein TH62_20290 [Bacillus sp. TH008]MDU0069873.1 hypothetical protein [Bacillus sp. IG6]MED8020933.1 hypothetical protein [Bacillus glycinifermentans]QAT65294.1 hypothetical protein EQZ20_10405 [Bacillus glycinifermentans]